MPSRPALALALLLAPALGGAQGTVQARDPRRPPPLEPPPECELWRGHIAGNDPTAEASLQMCTRGDAVTGVFLWSSLESGWNRRTFAGQWFDARQRLELHDSAMLENHPANGWRLCLAERYVLSRVSDAELSGEFWSRDCTDHGTIRITRVAQQQPPPPDATPAPVFVPAPPAERSTASRRRVFGCAVAVGAPRGGSVGWGAALLALAAISRCRGSRGRR